MCIALLGRIGLLQKRLYPLRGNCALTYFENESYVLAEGHGFARTPSASRLTMSVLSLNLMASEEELKAEIERLRAENQSLKKPTRGQISMKVSEKGGLSVYGLGRFPVTLYREQWEKLLGMAEEIRTFIRDNDQALKKKE